jgi:LPS-assembly lipoprotein
MMAKIAGSAAMKRILILFVILASAPLAACGFQPLYARSGGSDVPADLMRVQIGIITDPSPLALRGSAADYQVENDRSRQILRNFLSDDLAVRGNSVPRDYVLNIQLIEPRTNVAIDRSDTTLRYGYAVVAYFELRDRSGRHLMTGASTSQTSFAVSQSEFATIASQRDARERAMQEISIDIRNQLAAYFFTRSAKAPS